MRPTYWEPAGDCCYVIIAAYVNPEMPCVTDMRACITHDGKQAPDGICSTPCW
jgi:hypothetical protein